MKVSEPKLSGDERKDVGSKSRNRDFRSQKNVVIRGPRRILWFDILESVSICIMLCLHSVLWDWENVDKTVILPEDGIFPPILTQIMYFFMTLGGIFHFISGCVFVYLYTHRHGKRLYSRLQTFKYCVLLFILLSLYRFFVNIVTSRVDGLLYMLVSPIVKFEYDMEILKSQILVNCTLAAQSLNFLFMSPLVIFLFSKKTMRDVWILTSLGTIVLIATPYVRNYAYNLSVEYSGFFLIELILSHFHSLHFPVFPYFAFFLFGGVLGRFLAANSKKRVKSAFIFLGTILSLFALYGAIRLKLDYNFVLYPGLQNEVSLRSFLFQTHLQYMQLFFIFLLLLVGITFFDIYCREFFSRRFRWKGIPTLKLTIYSWGEVMKGIVIYVYAWLHPAWQQHLWSVLLFGVLQCVLWIVITVLWSKVRYKGSIESIFSGIMHSVLKKNEKS